MQNGYVYSRHEEFDNYVWKVDFMSVPPEEELADRVTTAPQVPTQDDWKLTFGSNKTLEIAEDVKVVEAHSHNSGQRLTLVYKNLGSFTFAFKTAKSLLEASAWHIKYENRSFRPNLKFHKNRTLIEGSGRNEDDDSQVQVKIDLRPEPEADWIAFYDTQDGMEQIIVQSLNFDEATSKMSADWEDEGHHFVIDGQFSRNMKNKTSKTEKVKFTLTTDEGDVKNFSGLMDANHSKIKGTWKYNMDGNAQQQPQSTMYFFEFNLARNVKGTLHMTMSDSNGKREVTEEIEVNYKKREIKPAEGMGGNIEEFYAIEAVDQAELCFFVLQRDATYVKCGQDSYI